MTSRTPPEGERNKDTQVPEANFTIHGHRGKTRMPSALQSIGESYDLRNGRNILTTDIPELLVGGETEISLRSKFLESLSEDPQAIPPERITGVLHEFNAAVENSTSWNQENDTRALEDYLKMEQSAPLLISSQGKAKLERLYRTDDNQRLEYSLASYYSFVFLALRGKFDKMRRTPETKDPATIKAAGQTLTLILSQATRFEWYRATGQHEKNTVPPMLRDALQDPNRDELPAPYKRMTQLFWLMTPQQRLINQLVQQATP